MGPARGEFIITGQTDYRAMEAPGKRPIILSALIVILVILPTLMETYKVPLLGYEVTLSHRDKIGDAELDAWYFSKPVSESFPPCGMEMRDIQAMVQNGTVVGFDFLLVKTAGPAVVDLSTITFWISTRLDPPSTTWEQANRYFTFFPKREDISTDFTYSVVNDPDGVLAKKQFSNDSSMSVSVRGLRIDPGAAVEFRFNSLLYQDAVYPASVPKYLLEVPLDKGYAFSLKLSGNSSSLPGPGSSDRLVRNETSLENGTFVLDGNVLVLENGSLSIRNSTVLVGSAPGRTLGLHVGTGGRMDIVNSTIDASDVEASYDFEVFGRLHMENSIVRHLENGLRIYSDDVSIKGSTLEAGVECLRASPVLANNTFHNLTEWHPYNKEKPCLDLIASSAVISGNSFTWEMNYYVPKITARSGSRPMIAGNSFDGAGWAIDTQDSASVIAGNFFRGQDRAIRTGLHSQDVIRDNNICATEYGIIVGGYCSISILNNTISPGIKVYSSTLELRGNKISGYKDMAIDSLRSEVAASENIFLPDANNTANSIRFRQQMDVNVFFSDGTDHYPRGIPCKVKRIESHGGNQWTKEEVKEGPLFWPNSFMGELTECVIDNEGVRTNITPHTVTFEVAGKTGSFEIRVNHTIIIFVIVKHWWYEGAYSGAGLISYVIATVAASAVLYIVVVYARQKWKSRPQVPGHKVRLSRQMTSLPWRRAVSDSHLIKFPKQSDQERRDGP